MKYWVEKDCAPLFRCNTTLSQHVLMWYWGNCVISRHKTRARAWINSIFFVTHILAVSFQWMEAGQSGQSGQPVGQSAPTGAAVSVRPPHQRTEESTAAAAWWRAKTAPRACAHAVSDWLNVLELGDVKCHLSKYLSSFYTSLLLIYSVIQSHADVTQGLMNSVKVVWPGNMFH